MDQTTPNEQGGVMSVREASRRLGISEWKVKNRLAEGELTGVKQVGHGFSRMQVSVASVERYAAKLAADRTAA
jgi:DNA-binding Lrp family transcriptional regulator